VVQMRWGAPAVTDPGLAAAGQGRSLDESLDAAW
jgi:hypothetical protein